MDKTGGNDPADPHEPDRHEPDRHEHDRHEHDRHEHDRHEHDRHGHDRHGHDRHEPDRHEPDRHEPGGSDGSDGGDGMFWRVSPGEVPAVVAAYRSAVGQAEQLSAALAMAGLADQVIAVTAELGAGGEPLVSAVITFAGARRLAAFLAAGGPPPPGLQLRDGHPPWAA